MKKDRKYHIVHVVGARPNFMKLAPLWHTLELSDWSKQTVIHTGQHFTPVMSREIFADLLLPPPDINLEIQGGSFLEHTAHMTSGIKKVLQKIRPDIVLVYGDVNSTLAGAIAAKWYGCALAHVEAGLRSRDLQMPEERNRVYVDHLSDLHFATSNDGKTNLITEGISTKNIVIAGNLMIDSLLSSYRRVRDTRLSEEIGKHIPESTRFAILTLHRPGNVDDKKTLQKIFLHLRDVSKKIIVLFPVHPRTEMALKKYNLWGKGTLLKEKVRKTGLYFLPPLVYGDFLRLYSRAAFVMTDSGGIQEETTALDIPCLTLRDNTERPVTITHGTNILVGSSCVSLTKEAENIVRGNIKHKKAIFGWDGKAAKRIDRALLKYMSRRYDH